MNEIRPYLFNTYTSTIANLQEEHYRYWYKQGRICQNIIAGYLIFQTS